MSKSGKVASNIINYTIISPFLKQIAKEKREDDKRFDKFLNQVDQDIQAELEVYNKQPKHFEVHQQYDYIIHENDFW